MMRLSICIATFNRARFIGETLDSILPQLPSNTELIVVDGASPDDTDKIVRPYLTRYSNLRYFRESANSGVDRDYDKAVGYASGEFCWLMTDDDLLEPGAVRRVLTALNPDVDLVVINSEVRDAALKRTLDSRLLKLNADRSYSPKDWGQFFADAGSGLSFIGGTVIRRSVWLSRMREPYWGSLFVHVGVIFQAKLQGVVKVISDPLILIRYGNAMWTARGFEIWMFKWPRLIWSFDEFSTEVKAIITPEEPWRNLKVLFGYRAKGAYSLAEYRKFLRDEPMSTFVRLVTILIACVPFKLANLVMVVRCRWAGAPAQMFLVDLVAGKKVTWLARRIAGIYQ